MDIKFKKLLLLTMRMNDANNFMIRASPRKVVNLQMFASVFILCSFYNNCTIYILYPPTTYLLKHNITKRYMLFQVISMSYNIISVMLKSMDSNNQSTE